MKVTFSRLHTIARRQRRGAALIALVLFLSCAVVLAHSSAGGEHMGVGTAMCMAVMSLGAVSLLGLTRALAQRLRAPFTPYVLVAPPRGVVAVPVVPRSRAGPAVLQVFLR